MRPAASPAWFRPSTIAIVLVVALPLGPRALGDEPRGKPDPVDRALNFVGGLPHVADGVRDRPPNPWLDRVVVLKSLRTDLRIESRTVPMPAGRVFHTFTIKRVEPREKGEWLWIVDGLLKGWVDSTEVVLHDEAYAFYSSLIDRNPNSAEPFYLRGALGKGDDLADLTEAIRLDPKLAIAHVARAEVYSDKRKDDDRALADLAEAIRLDPKLEVAYLQRAFLFFEKDADRAIADLTEAIRLNPGDGPAYQARGVCHYGSKHWDRAIADLGEAIRFEPADERASPVSKVDVLHFLRADAHSKREESDRAIADFTEAARLSEAKGLLRDEGLIFASLFSRAGVYDEKRDHERAIVDFTEALARSPKEGFTAAGHAARAMARTHAGDLEGALADHAEALRHDPPPVVAAVSYMNRGRIESDRDELEAALSDLAKAIAVLPTNPHVYVTRANVLNDHGRHDRALADCDLAVEMAPEDAWGHDFRAWIRATCPDPKFRDGQQAVAEATRACELTGWKRAYCLETLAAAQAEVGDFDAALRSQTRALALARDDESRGRARGRIELFRNKQPYRDVRPAAGQRRASHELPEIPLTAR